MHKLPKYIYLLLLAQGINLIAAVLSVTVAAIVGLSLAPTDSFATIPYGLQFFAILVSTLLFSHLMKKIGRYPVFNIGIFFLFLSGIFGFFAVYQHHFILLCLSHFSLGLFISTANFYRFAATDGLANNLIPQATSMVISGGVIAAIIAPFLAIRFEKVPNFPQYSLIYLILSVLAVVLFFIIYFWHKYNQKSQKVEQVKFEQRSNISSVPMNLILIGIISGAVGYYLMNLMMIASSLFLKNSHSFHYASVAIQLHVLAMFLPSFFVSRCIKSLGTVNTIILGFMIMSLSSFLPAFFSASIYVNISLILLGIGWNFSYSGGSVLIGALVGEQKIKIQGINETCIALFATLGAFMPAPLLSYLGWVHTNLLSALIGAVIAILIVALKLRKKGYAYEN